jgi:hypothetical protein
MGKTLGFSLNDNIYQTDDEVNAAKCYLSLYFLYLTVLVEENALEATSKNRNT